MNKKTKERMLPPGMSTCGMLHLGPYTIPVVIDSRMENMDGAWIRLSHGQCIRLRQGLLPERVRVVLLHEIVHGALDMYRDSGALENEELVCDAVSNTLAQCWSEIEDVLKFYEEAEGR